MTHTPISCQYACVLWQRERERERVVGRKSGASLAQPRERGEEKWLVQLQCIIYQSAKFEALISFARYGAWRCAITTTTTKQHDLLRLLFFSSSTSAHICPLVLLCHLLYAFLVCRTHTQTHNASQCLSSACYLGPDSLLLCVSVCVTIQTRQGPVICPRQMISLLGSALCSALLRVFSLCLN